MNSSKLRFGSSGSDTTKGIIDMHHSKGYIKEVIIVEKGIKSYSFSQTTNIVLSSLIKAV